MTDNAMPLTEIADALDRLAARVRQLAGQQPLTKSRTYGSGTYGSGTYNHHHPEET